MGRLGCRRVMLARPDEEGMGVAARPPATVTRPDPEGGILRRVGCTLGPVD